MQVYRLLGTLQTTLLRKVLVARLIACGWAQKTVNDDEDLLRQHNIQLRIEGEGTVLLDASFKGKPEDVSLLLTSLNLLQIHYALDLFGDSARLVRRFVK